MSKTEDAVFERILTDEEIVVMYEALKALVDIVDVDGSPLEPYFIEPVRQAQAIVATFEARSK